MWLGKYWFFPTTFLFYILRLLVNFEKCTCCQAYKNCPTANRELERGHVFGGEKKATNCRLRSLLECSVLVNFSPLFINNYSYGTDNSFQRCKLLKCIYTVTEEECLLNVGLPACLLPLVGEFFGRTLFYNAVLYSRRFDSCKPGKGNG